MADKTRNNYLASPENYTKLLSDAITKDHKKDGQNIVNAINIEASKITDSLDISDKVDQFRLQDPFCSIKDHKDTFPARVDVRLINPSKSSIGVISKNLLDRINDTIRSNSQFKQ